MNPPQTPSTPISKEAVSQIHEFANSSTASDKLARQEQDNALREGKRGESLRTHIHIIVIIGMYIGAFVITAMVIIWGLHLLLPPKDRWLTDEENHTLERIIFSSGLIISIAGRYFKKYHILDDK